MFCSTLPLIFVYLCIYDLFHILLSLWHTNESNVCMYVLMYVRMYVS